MNKKILIPLTLWFLWHACQNISDQTQKNINETFSQEQSAEQKTPKINYEISLPYEQQQIIEKIVKEYFSQYPCSMKILTISAEVVENQQTLAHAKPHTIYLNTDRLDDVSIKNTITHEFFHTIKPDSLRIVSPYILQDGYKIVGYHGLSIVVSTGKEQTQFWVFEDAAAEACASLYDSEYSVPNIYYANVWSLMLKIIHNGRLTVDDLIFVQSTNDIDGFVQKIYNKTTTPQDVESLMQIFNDVYMTEEDLTEQALKKIEKIRNN